jgi:hypothetical protein
MSEKKENVVDELLAAVDAAVSATTELAKGTVAGRKAALLQKSLDGGTSDAEAAELAGLLLGTSKDSAELIKSQIMQSENVAAVVDASAAFEDLVKSTTQVVGELTASHNATQAQLDERFAAVAAVISTSGELMKSVAASLANVADRLEKLESAPLPRQSVASSATAPIVDRAGNGVTGAERVQKSDRELASEWIQALSAKNVAKTVGGESVFQLATQLRVGGLSVKQFEDLKRTAQG